MATPRSYGEFTESFVRQTAVLGGQSDFVYRPVRIRKGSGSREVGDTLILLGRQAVIIQVKSRDISKHGSDSPTRARSWLEKNIAEAVRQIDGTARTLWRSSMKLRSERGVEIEWRPDRIDELFGLVVINYTPPPDYEPTLLCSVPTVALHASDWELLNKMAYTTSGVLEYIKGRSALPWLHVPLGEERDMIGAALLVEHSGEELTFVKGRPPTGSFDRLVAEYPVSVFGSQRNDRLAYMIDAMIMGAADRDPEFSSSMHPDDYLRIVEILERIPRLDRVPLGEKIMEKCHLAYEQRRERHFVSRLSSGGRFLFVSDPASREDRLRFLTNLAVAVHLELDIPEARRNDGVTLGVATEPFPNGGRSHDYVLIEGSLDMPDDARQACTELLKSNSAPVRPIDQAVIERALAGH